MESQQLQKQQQRHNNIASEKKQPIHWLPTGSG